MTSENEEMLFLGSDLLFWGVFFKILCDVNRERQYWVPAFFMGGVLLFQVSMMGPRV